MGKIHASQLKIGDKFFYHNRTGVFEGTVVDEDKKHHFRMPFWNVQTPDGEDLVFKCDYVYDSYEEAADDFVRMAKERLHKMLEKQVSVFSEIEAIVESIKKNQQPKLRVFSASRSGMYSGGLIMVAAHNIEEAIEVYRKSKHAEDECLYEECDGEVVWDRYPAERWKEVPDVFAEYDEPRIIEEAGYTE